MLSTVGPRTEVNMRVWLAVFTIMISHFAYATKVSDGTQVDGQEHVDEASRCMILFTLLGDDKSAQLAFGNVMWSIQANSALEVTDLEAEKPKLDADIEGLRESLEGAGATKREVMFYLLSQNSCLVHATQGGIYFLNNQRE